MDRLIQHGMSWKQCIKTLESNGFKKARSNGGHQTLKKGSRSVTVVIHRPHDTVPPNVVNSINRQVAGKPFISWGSRQG